MTTKAYLTRIERSEGKLEERFTYPSKSQVMNGVNEGLMALRRDSMRGLPETGPILFFADEGSAPYTYGRTIHQASRRGKQPWYVVNCCEVSDEQLEADFRGTATEPAVFAESARGGTVFFHRIEKLSQRGRSAIIEFLKNREKNDVRVMASLTTSTGNGDGAGSQSNIPDDLKSYLLEKVITIPSLNKRIDEILVIATDYADKIFKANGKSFRGFSADVESLFCNYPWPGNVEEMYAVITRASFCDENGKISMKSVTNGGFQFGEAKISNGNQGSTLSLVTGFSGGEAALDPEGYMGVKKKWTDQFEKEYLAATLKRHHGNVSAAAREAKLDRSNFLRLMRRHGLKSAPYRYGIGLTLIQGGEEANQNQESDSASESIDENQKKAA